MRLSTATLARLPDAVAVPDYDRAAARRGVVHLGIGAFHRAHQAVLFDRALAAGDPRWGVTGVSLRSSEVRDRLLLQDGLYTLVERDGAGERARVIGSVLDVLVAPENPDRVVAALAARDTHLVTLTITEKAYLLDRATGALRSDDPAMAHDLADLAEPRTAAGFLVAGLARRRDEGGVPLTILSCDNLPANGALLRAAILALAEAHDAGLAKWIAEAVAFPSAMVDRIVPATTEQDIAALQARYGVEDRGTVATEPFFQWVIEDRFAGPRPDFAALGARLTDDVSAWEAVKLRLLNGAHSAIAYLGALGRDTFVHQFVARPEARTFVEALWQESAATLRPPPGLDLTTYRADLMARFANPALQHRTRQIAMDGSQKLPQRLVAPLAKRRARGLPIEALALGIAAWMRWQGGRDDAGVRHVIEDPLAGPIAAAARAPDPVRALLAIEAIFPPVVAADPVVRETLERHFAALAEQGAVAVVAAFPGPTTPGPAR